MKFTIGIALLFLFFSTSIAQDSLLIAAFKKNSYPLQMKNGQLSGKGFDFLDEVGKTTPFFLIGEDHGMAEVPLFTAALFKAFKKYDYQYFATETGSYTAEFLQKTGAKKEMYAELETFFKKYIWSIPFYSFREECTILEAVLEGKEQEERVIWGLDQEFAASFRMHFNYLKNHAQNEDSKQVANTYYEKTMDAFKEMQTSKNPSKAFMATATPKDFETLKTAFKAEPKNLKLIEELEESIYIYQLFFKREGYESNRLRAEMMKRHFWEYYSKAKQKDNQPKVMFKFGANHIYRGLNALNVSDIGSFVSELASQEGTSSFHLLVVGKKGTQNAYTPFSQSDADKKKAFDAAEYKNKIDMTTLLKATPNDTWSVVDLRPLRKALFNKSIRNAQSGLEKVIWSYDAILIIPEVSASTFFE